MLATDRNLPTAPICRVICLGFRAIEEEIQHWIARLMLGVNVEVVGRTGGVFIRVWSDGLSVQRYVHPEDYVAHSHLWERRNPTFAAVVGGLTELLGQLRSRTHGL